MRYLTRRFAVGAVRRGAIVGQLLGGFTGDGPHGARRGLRVLTVQPDGDAYCLFVHDIEDTGHDSDAAELAELPPWSTDGADDGDATVCSETPDALLSYAEAQLGADPGRWVNGSMLDDEYADFVRAGRPADLAPPRRGT